MRTCRSWQTLNAVQFCIRFYIYLLKCFMYNPYTNWTYHTDTLHNVAQFVKTWQNHYFLYHFFAITFILSKPSPTCAIGNYKYLMFPLLTSKELKD